MKLDFLKKFEFFTGVPDSQLRPLCDWLMSEYGISGKHIIAANEGNAAALAAGYHLATGKVPVVYLQNSGIGNIINPVASLMNRKVYAMPCLFIIGWRGEPGVHDEPQHIFQGEVTLKLLEDMDIAAFVLDKNTNEEKLAEVMRDFEKLFAQGKQAALVVRKGTLESCGKVAYSNGYEMTREEIIRRVAARGGDDIIVSTTGKASRELFEIREQAGEGHEKDFLTVGCMGHSSSIALSIALNKPEKRVRLIDGDGALLMHMGALAVIGANSPKNLLHILINNGAHETVGGMPTVSPKVDFCAVAKACGYPAVFRAESYEELDGALSLAEKCGTLCFVEAFCSLDARENLGRPTTTALENKENFMKYLSK